MSGAVANVSGPIAPSNPLGVGDYWVDRAVEEVFSTYGDKVSVEAKNKSLNKFGRTSNADSGETVTVMGLLGATTYNETFSTTNDIDGIVSTDDDDDQTLTVEGHYYDGSNNLVFSTQQVTLTGQTKATLDPVLCRSTRAFPTNGTFASPATGPGGTVYVYASSGVTLDTGVPQTATSVKLILDGAAGKTQTEKCATSISYQDYWILTGVTCAAQRGNSSTVTVDVDVEYRQQGGVWRPLGLEMSLRTAGVSFIERNLNPYTIIPKNSDVRMVAVSNTNDTTVSGRICGVLAAVQ